MIERRMEAERKAGPEAGVHAKEAEPVSPTIDLVAREIADLIEGNQRLRKTQIGKDVIRLPKEGYEREIKDEEFKIQKLEKKLVEPGEDQEKAREDLEKVKIEKAEMAVRHGVFGQAQAKKEFDFFDFAFDTVLNAYEIAGNPFKYSKSALEEAVKPELIKREREHREATQRKEDKARQEVEESQLVRVSEELVVLGDELGKSIKRIESSISPDTAEGRALRESIQAQQIEINNLMGIRGSWYQSKATKDKIQRNAQGEAEEVKRGLNTTVRPKIQELEDALHKVRTVISDLERGGQKEGKFFKIGDTQYYTDPKIQEAMDARHKELKDQTGKLSNRAFQETERVKKLINDLIISKEIKN